MKKIFIIFISILCFQKNYANDSLVVWLKSNHYKQGDTIEVEVALNKLKKENRMQSVFVIIQNTETNKTWKFRYPLINGFVNFDFTIDSQMKSGNYAFSFLLNPQFYTINATINEGAKKETTLKYSLLTKNKNAIFDKINLLESKKFQIKNLVYPDTAFIFFSSIQKKRRNDLDITIQTPLDSAFKPTYSVTNFISIGNVDTLKLQKIQQSKTYDWQKNMYKNTGEIVTVVGKNNGKLKQFEKEKVSSTFKSIDEIVIDGLGTEELANAADLFSFLLYKIPGIQTIPNSENGMLSLQYRKEPVTIYVNELKLSEDDFPSINTDDIAMIKFFRSNTMLSNGKSAILAIYTKNPGDYNQPKNKYSFKVMGYHLQSNILK